MKAGFIESGEVADVARLTTFGGHGQFVSSVEVRTIYAEKVAGAMSAG